MSHNASFNLSLKTGNAKNMGNFSNMYVRRDFTEFKCSTT